jgi:hypothetical protein
VKRPVEDQAVCERPLGDPAGEARVVELQADK